MNKALVCLLMLGLCGFALAEDKSDVQQRLDIWRPRRRPPKG